MDQPARGAALERLDTLVGAWTLEARFPNYPAVTPGSGRSGFEWMSGGQLLIQRTEAPAPAPHSLAIVVPDRDAETYTQHYFDSRGVARLYRMSFADGVWKLWRDAPDFSPLDFCQRFTGTLSDDGDTIRGAWETSSDGAHWEHDFDLTYRRMK